MVAKNKPQIRGSSSYVQVRTTSNWWVNYDATALRLSDERYEKERMTNREQQVRQRSLLLSWDANLWTSTTVLLQLWDCRAILNGQRQLSFYVVVYFSFSENTGIYFAVARPIMQKHIVASHSIQDRCLLLQYTQKIGREKRYGKFPLEKKYYVQRKSYSLIFSSLFLLDIKDNSAVSQQVSGTS